MITGRRKFNFIHLVVHLHDELFRFSPLSALESHDCHTHQLCVHNPADRNARSAHTTLESTRALSQRLRTRREGKEGVFFDRFCGLVGSSKNPSTFLVSWMGGLDVVGWCPLVGWMW